MFMGVLKKKRNNSLFHLSHKKENIEDLVNQFSGDDLLDEDDLPPLPFRVLGSNVLDGSIKAKVRRI